MLAFYLTVFGSFLCLMPLALYCLIVANVYRRPHPTLISGPTEFLGTMLALSGFLIVGGPAVLAGALDLWRHAMYRGSFAGVSGFIADAGRPWLLAWFGYFAAVVAGCLMIARRRRATATICSIEPDAMTGLIGEVGRRLDVPIARRGAAFVFGGIARSAVLDIRPAPVLRSVTLLWRSDPADMRLLVEEDIRRMLTTVSSPRNSVAGWLAGVAGVIFVVQFVALFLLGVAVFSARP